MDALVFSEAGVWLGTLDSFRELTTERKAYKHNTVSITLNVLSDPWDLVQKGRRLVVPLEGTPTEYLAFRIDQTETTLDDDLQSVIVAQGRELGGLLDRRIIIPPAGQSHDKQTNVPAETAIKHYVSDH